LEIEIPMAWTELATTSLRGGQLVLYRDGGAYMIRFDGLELMNSRWHGSEDELGALAGAMAPRPNPRVLLGGLGLGYTLAALVRALGSGGQITVAEISTDVIAWFERWLEPTLFAERPTNVRLVAADVATLLQGEAKLDVVILDVDNGPGRLLAMGNQSLYRAEGLVAVRSGMAEAGLLLVWSSIEAPDFIARAEDAGFAVACRPVVFPGRPHLFHYIYQLSAQRPGKASTCPGDRQSVPAGGI
jgi:spermidine synthase